MPLKELQEQILELRSQQKLHKYFQARLKTLVESVIPGGYVSTESYGVAKSHRVDGLVCMSDKSLVHLELFATASQVTTDGATLLQSDAHVKVAVIIDSDIDGKVANRYFKEFSSSGFYFVWLSNFLDLDRTSEIESLILKYVEEARILAGPLLPEGPQLTVEEIPYGPFSPCVVGCQGFHPGTDVHLYWDPLGKTRYLGFARSTSPRGECELSFTLPDGGLATVGNHTLRAVDDLGNAAVTEIHVSKGWPVPYLQISPDIAKPGQVIEVRGEGAPANVELTVFFWNDRNMGHGVGIVGVDQLGSFRGEIDLPWFKDYRLVEPSSESRISCSPSEGGFGFQVSVPLTIDEYNPPGIFQWESRQSSGQYGVVVLEPLFRVENKVLTIEFDVRNDRDSSVSVLPIGELAILMLGPELTNLSLTFECKTASWGVLSPGARGRVMLEFERMFDEIPRTSQTMGGGTLRLAIPFRDEVSGEIFWFQVIEQFPVEVWVSRSNEPPESEDSALGGD